MRAVFLLIALAAAACAHRLNVHISDENGTVAIRAYFTLSAPCRECPIVVETPSGEKLADLKTDDNGYAYFQAKTAEMVVKADGGSGHFAQVDYALETPIATDDDAPIFAAKLALALVILGAFFGVIWRIKTLRKS
ncbi:hypothetical protein FACS189487_03070 [Campylobacterota bacterium]|nr:hypothetical protein FACS189487_03070 [Campylobacterota bacterium]